MIRDASLKLKRLRHDTNCLSLPRLKRWLIYLLPQQKLRYAFNFLDSLSTSLGTFSAITQHAAISMLISALHIQLHNFVCICYKLYKIAISYIYNNVKLFIEYFQLLGLIFFLTIFRVHRLEGT